MRKIKIYDLDGNGLSMDWTPFIGSQKAGSGIVCEAYNLLCLTVRKKKKTKSVNSKK